MWDRIRKLFGIKPKNITPPHEKQAVRKQIEDAQTTLRFIELRKQNIRHDNG